MGADSCIPSKNGQRHTQLQNGLQKNASFLLVPKERRSGTNIRPKVAEFDEQIQNMISFFKICFLCKMMILPWKLAWNLKISLGKGEPSTNHQFWGSMSVFGGVCHQISPTKSVPKICFSQFGGFSRENPLYFTLPLITESFKYLKWRVSCTLFQAVLAGGESLT